MENNFLKTSISKVNKIAILHPMHWEQTNGGAEMQIKYLIDQLLALNNFQVYFIFEDSGTSVSSRDNLFLYPLPQKALIAMGENHALNLIRVFRTLKNIKPDYLYTRMICSWSGVASFYAKKFSVKHIWAISSDFGVGRRFSLMDHVRPLNFISFISTTYSFKYASAIVCQNEYQKQVIMRIHNRDCFKIPQSSPANVEEIRKETPHINVLWIANFKPLKQPELFKKLAMTLSSQKKMKFYMIGRLGKNYKMEDWNIPKDNLHYLGELHNSEVNQWLSKSHILVNTSLYEGFSNTFLQAWLRKVPVVSLNSNPDELLTYREIGLLSLTFEKLVEDVKKLVEEVTLRYEMGERAFNYANQYHTIEKNLPRILELLD